jgi:hypothetical protein
MPRRARPSRSSGSSCSRMRHIGPATPVVPVRERAGHRRWRCAHESGVIADGTLSPCFPSSASRGPRAGYRSAANDPSSMLPAAVCSEVSPPRRNLGRRALSLATRFVPEPPTSPPRPYEHERTPRENMPRVRADANRSYRPSPGVAQDAARSTIRLQRVLSSPSRLPTNPAAVDDRGRLCSGRCRSGSSTARSIVVGRIHLQRGQI